MAAQELAALTTALDDLRAAHRDNARADHQAAVIEADRNNTSRPHAPRSGRPQVFPFPQRVLATILQLRLGLPDDTLAHLFTTNRGTIHRAVKEIQQLLNEHGTTIMPAPTPPSALVNLLAAAAAEPGIHP